MSQPPGLRERKKRNRRNQIETVAIGLFIDHGFEQTTIQDIAEQAEISPRTFFSYFPTKEDVVLADYADRLNKILTELDHRPSSEEPWEALHASFVEVAADYQSKRQQLIRRFSLMAANPSVFARSLQLQSDWENALAAKLNQRVSGEGKALSHHLMASAALAIMRSSLRFWIQSNFQTPLPQLVEKCFSDLAEGLTRT